MSGVSNTSSRPDYFSSPSGVTGTTLSPPSFSHSLNGEWSDETPLSPSNGESLVHSPLQTNSSTDLVATSGGGCATTDGSGLSLLTLSSNFASVQQLPAFPTLNDFAHHGEAVFPAEKFQTLITMYRAHSQHIMDLVSLKKNIFKSLVHLCLNLFLYAEPFW